MKIYIILFNIFMCVFLGSSILLSLAHFFKEAHWSKAALPFTPLVKWISARWFILLLPLSFASIVYPWKIMEGHKALYFTPIFLWIRQLLYIIGIYIGTKSFEKRPALSLILFFLIGSFFSFDWALSLESHWFSNMYGFLYLSSGVQAAMALVMYKNFEKNDDSTKKDLIHLLLTLSLLWFYLNFSQFLIMWMGNLPREVGWYVDRMKGWTLVFWVLFVIFKIIPVFLISFFNKLKTHPHLVKIICLLTLAGFVLEMVWLLVPSMNGGHL